MKVYKFCRSKCCPVIRVEDDSIYIEESMTNEGFGGSIKMKQESFKDLILAAKEGKFDGIIDV